MPKQKIVLKIAGASYPFEIEAADEETYRRAEKEVNRLMADYSNSTLLPKDRLALAALALGIENIRLSTSRNVVGDIDRLVDIEQMLDNYILSLER
jgi:hypothetical protein